MALGDQSHDLAHDPVELEVFGGVDGGNAGGLQLRDVGVRDDAADDDRDVGAVQGRDDVGDQLAVGAREDREPDDVDAFVDGGAGDLGGRQADAFVDDVHAGVPCSNG